MRAAEVSGSAPEGPASLGGLTSLIEEERDPPDHDRKALYPVPPSSGRYGLSGTSGVQALPRAAL